MDKVVYNPWFIRCLALFFSLLLFVNANSEGNKRLSLSNSENYEKISEQVPINYKYDESKYYISGYEESATVTLKSSNKVLLDMESNEETRNYSLNVDLTKYKPGTYEVPVKISKLNNAVSGSLSLKKVHVTIEKKETASFKVSPVVDAKIFADGYSLKSATASPEKVSITSGKDTLNSIAKVTATIKNKKNIQDDFTQKVELQAFDKNGDVLDIKAEPVSVSVLIKVNKPSKTVSLKVVQKGELPSGVESFSFSLSVTKIDIVGEESLLKKISELDVPVNIAKITDSVESYYPISIPNKIVGSLSTVLVKVIPNYKGDTSESSTAMDNSTATMTPATATTNHTTEQTTTTTTTSSSSSTTSESSESTETSTNEN